MKRTLLALIVALWGGPSSAIELISAAEASLPAGHRQARATRAITRGPGIQLISPASGSAEVQSPFDLHLEFVPRGAARIALDSVKVVYDRHPPVDLKERVRTGLTDRGIVLSGARAPAGRHRLVVSVADSEGRTTTREFELTIAK